MNQSTEKGVRWFLAVVGTIAGIGLLLSIHEDIATGITKIAQEVRLPYPSGNESLVELFFGVIMCLILAIPVLVIYLLLMLLLTLEKYLYLITGLLGVGVGGVPAYFWGLPVVAVVFQGLGKIGRVILAEIDPEARRQRKQVRAFGKQVQSKEMVHMTERGQEVTIPAIFDEARIRRDLMRYDGYEDKGALRAYLSGLAKRFKTDVQIQTVRKLTELLNVGTEYFEAAYQFTQAQDRLRGVKEEQDLAKERRKTEKDEEELKREEISFKKQEFAYKKDELAFKREELVLKREQLRQERQAGQKRRPLTEQEKRDQEVETAVRDIQRGFELEKENLKTMFERERFFSEMEEEIRKHYPSDIAERIIDRVSRSMTEEE